MPRFILPIGAALAALLALWPNASAQQVPENRALLVVRLPANGVLTIDTVPTRQTGDTRKFISPPLPAGKAHHYTLHATWTENGQQYQATKKVPVQPGQQVEVDLRADAAAMAKDQPKAVVKGESAPAGKSPKSRTFQFAYSAKVTDLPPDKVARVWLPMASSNEFQDVDVVEIMAPPGAKTDREPQYGNKIFYVEAKPEADGTLPVTIIYKVTRREVVGPAKDEGDVKQLARFLQGDAMGPLDGKHLDLIKGKTIPADGLAAGKLLYDVVDDHVKYSKDGKGWGRGDVAWVCDSKYGNCTDFHGLFIALARAQRIPAKFEMGFSVPTKRGEGDIGGYHCWAWFKPKDKGWIGVDISEADKDPTMKEYYFGNLTEDRVQFTTGRDINLVPKQDGPPLNFFVYPYVEVDGKPHDKVNRKFAYKDE